MVEKVLFLVVMGIIGFTGVAPPEVCVGLVGVYCIGSLIVALGKGIPIVEITSCVYWLQLLLCPLVSYYQPPAFFRYWMVVTPDVYFSFAIPAVCLYLVPLAIARSKIPYMTRIMQQSGGSELFNIGMFLVAVGLAFDVTGRYAPVSVRFVFFLGSELKFVGALYCYFSNHAQRRWALAVVVGLAVVSALSAAMFHQLIIWGAILVSIVIARERPHASVWLRLGIVGVGCLSLFGLQSFKKDLRDIRDAHPEMSTFDQVAALAMGEADRVEKKNPEVLAVRFNQGWIVARILRHVPAKEPYADGETLMTAAIDSVIPRMFNPNKSNAGGRENINRFAGLMVNNKTSMGISPAGEAYANFGSIGGVIVMLGYGLIFALLFFFLARRGMRTPLFYLWLPMVFSQAIKAETELVVVLNHLAKASLFAIAGYYVLHQLLNAPDKEVKKLVPQAGPTMQPPTQRVRRPTMR